MAIDLGLLRIIKYREYFFKVVGRVPASAMEKTTNVLIEDFKEYFQKFPEHNKIDLDMFMTVFSARHPDIKEDRRTEYRKVMRAVVKADINENDRDSIMNELYRLRFASDLATKLTQYEAGELADVFGAVGDLTAEYRRDANVGAIDYVRDDVGELLANLGNEVGLRWRLPCLASAMRPLVGGDFGIIAARPDKGKSTFVSSEVTYLAAQDTRPTVIFNNESIGARMKLRVWQAALGMTTKQMLALSTAGTLASTYNGIMGGPDKIRIFDAHGFDRFQLEDIIAEHMPAVVVYDMVDNVNGFGDAARTDSRLEKMYQWARDVGIKYDSVGLATSQVSFEGDNLQFPPFSALKDSKTGKQGACDFGVMIGSLNDPGWERTRWIGLPKNKLVRQGSPGDPRAQVAFKPEIARYDEVPILEETPEDE